MKHGSLFSGYGGLDMAVEAAFHANTVWHSEFDKSASAVLAYHYPDIPNLGDITKIDWSAVEPVDIASGGSPCQDLSHVGRRGGMLDGNKSGLWSAMREGIAVLRPKFVIWENVRGAYSAKARSEVERTEGRVGAMRAAGRVLGDLASLGYDAAWTNLRASTIGAPHKRDRVFILAWPTAYTDSITVQPRYELGGLDGSGFQAGGKPARSVVQYRTRYQNGSAETDRNPYARWGEYAEAVDVWSQATREAPYPVTDRNDVSPHFTEWVMGLPDGWVSEVPGVSYNNKLKLCGNGVVPQQAFAAINTLLTIREGMIA